MSDKRSKKKHLHAKSADTPLIYKIFLSALKSSLIAFTTSFLLALVLSAITVKASDPTALLTPLSLAALYLSSFVGGFFSVRDKGDSVLICGTASGALFMLLYKLCALFLPSEASDERKFLVSALLHILIIFFSCLGAYAAMKMKKSKKRKRR